jgi:triple functional domain protein
MSPYFPSNGDESASERETVDGSVLLSSPELAELKYTASEIEDLLNNKMVILSGGRDKEGQSILTVPARPKDFNFNRDEFRRVVQYLTSLPRDEIRECGFSIIIDGRNATWSSIKNLLKMFQECLPEQIHVAYIVSPAHFLEKRRVTSKSGKEKLEFSTVVVGSQEKLVQQVLSSQVTTDLGGLMPYDHKKWLKLRLDLEHFILTFNSLMKQWAAFECEVRSDLLAEDTEGAEMMIAQHASLLQDIRGAPKSALKEGSDLLVSIERDQDNFGASNMTPEKIDSVDIIRNLLERINRTGQDLEDVWRMRKQLLDQNLQLRYFEKTVGKINVWLKGKSPEFFGGEQDIGQSIRTSQDLLDKHEKTEAKTKDIHEKVTKLRMMVDRMCGGNHFASDDLKQQIAKLIGRWTHYQEMASWRKDLLEKALSFHRTESKFTTTCSHLTKQVQGTFPKITSHDVIPPLIKKLSEDHKTLKGVSEDAMEKGKDLVALMHKVMTEGQPPAEYRKGILHVEELQYSIRDKMTTFNHLVEARMTGFDQCQQIFKYEEDIAKVITWLRELSGQMMSSLGDLGESEEATAQLEQEHRKFAETAKKTYLGGQDLLAIAVKNRKEYHMDQMPCTNLKRELEKVWKAISDGISEREKRLEMAKEFHHVSEDILLEVDRMTRPTSPVVAMVGDSSHQGDDLKQRIKHAIDLGEHILKSLEHSSVELLGGRNPGRKNDSAVLSMELIRFRIERMRAVLSEMDNLLMMREKGKKDAIQLSELEEDVAGLTAWFTGEGRVTLTSVLHPGMQRSDLRRCKLTRERALMEKHKMVEELKERARFMAGANQFGGEVLSMVEKLEGVWTDCTREFSATFDICNKYISFLELFGKVLHDAQRFMDLCMQADSNWQSTTPQVVEDLQLLRDSLSSSVDQLCEDGEVTIEELRGRSVSSGPIIEDCRSKTLEIKKRQNQVDSEWAKVESTLKNTVRLKEFREEAVVVLVDMKELIHHSLSNVKFGDDIEDFDQREEEFVNSEQKCRLCLRRCEELKSSIQHLVMLGVAGESEEDCEQLVMEMNAVLSTMRHSLEAVVAGFEEARNVVRKCERLTQDITLLDQKNPTLSRDDHLRHLVQSKDSLTSTYHNWCTSVRRFAAGEQLKTVFDRVCQLAESVVGDFVHQEESLQKVKHLSQDVEKHTEWLENKLRQWLPRNSDLGDNGDEAKELKSRYTNFIASIQPSFKELNNLMTRCRTLCSADLTLEPMVTVHLRRLMESNEVCSGTLSERLDVITAFVDFSNIAGKLFFCVGRVDRHCEDIPVIMESGQEGRDLLHQGREAVHEMEYMVEGLRKQAEIFNQRASTPLETTLGPPLVVRGALNRVASELQGLSGKAIITGKIWQQGEVRIQMSIELGEFRLSHMQIMTWLDQQGFPFLSGSIGSRLSEVDGMILEQEEFVSKVNRIEKELNTAIIIGNDITAKSHSHAQEIDYAIAEMMTTFARFKQLVDLKTKVLNKARVFYKTAKKLSEKISKLSLEERVNIGEDLAKDLNHLQASVNGIIVMAAELQQSGKPPIAQHLLDVVHDLQRQLVDTDYERGISLESPLMSPIPTEQPSMSLTHSPPSPMSPTPVTPPPKSPTDPTIGAVTIEDPMSAVIMEPQMSAVVIEPPPPMSAVVMETPPISDVVMETPPMSAVVMETPPMSPSLKDSTPRSPKPAPPRRTDSFRKYRKFVSKPPGEQEDEEDVDAGKRIQVRSVAMVKKDLLRSENEYVYRLSVLVDEYLCQLAQSSNRPDFVVDRKKAIFGNVEEVYSMHKKLKTSLDRAKATDDVCKVFLNMELEFRIYVNYLRTVSVGWQTLKRYGGNFFENVRKDFRLSYTIAECHDATFHRLQDYLRLFKELHGSTQKEELHSSNTVEQVIIMLTKLDKVCSKIVAFANLTGGPDDLDEDGLLLVDKFQVTTIQKKKKHQPRLLMVFLHESAVVLASEDIVDDIHPPFYRHHGHIRCSQMMLTEDYKGKQRFALSDGPISSANTVHAFQYTDKEHVMADKNKWVDTLKKLLMKQLRELKAKTGMPQHILPPPIVHHVSMPKDKDRVSRISQRLSEDTAAAQEEDKRMSSLKIERVSGLRVVQQTGPAETAHSDVEVYEVCGKYTAQGNEELQLSMGQLVEVLDQSDEDRWFVCTIASGMDQEPMEGFVPSKYLRKYTSGRPQSIVSQYSYVSDNSGDRRSTGSFTSDIRDDVLLEASLQILSSRPTSMVHPSSPSSGSGGSRPISVVSSMLPQPQDRPTSIISGGVVAPPPSSAPEDITWFTVAEVAQGGLYLARGEAVEVLDSSGPRWYIITINDPREGFVDPAVLSNSPPTPQVTTQQSVVEATTPTVPSLPHPSLDESSTPIAMEMSKSLGGGDDLLSRTLTDPITILSSVHQEPVGGRTPEVVKLGSPEIPADVKTLDVSMNEPKVDQTPPVESKVDEPASPNRPIEDTLSAKIEIEESPVVKVEIEKTAVQPPAEETPPVKVESSSAKPPIAEKPVMSTKPAVDESLVAKKPANKPPIAEKPTVRPPVANKPAGKPPVASKPAGKPPLTNKPAVKSPGADKPAVRSPSADKPAVRSPGADKPAVGVKPLVRPKPSSLKPKAGNFLEELQGQFGRKQSPAVGAGTTPVQTSPQDQLSRAEEVRRVEQPNLMEPSVDKMNDIRVVIEDPPPSKLFVALANFAGDEETNIPLCKDELVEVVDDSSAPGWWLVRPVASTNKREGWVPAEYLQRAEATPPGGNSPTPGEKTPPSGYGSGTLTPTGLEAQTPGILVSNPFDRDRGKSPVLSPPVISKPPIYTAAAHVTAQGPNEMSLQLAENVEVIDSTRDDWWLVRTLSAPITEGWVQSRVLSPATFIGETHSPPPKISGPPSSSGRVALANFTADGPGQISLKEGQMVEIIDDSRGDWTLVRTVDSAHLVEGWVPHNYLK